TRWLRIGSRPAVEVRQAVRYAFSAPIIRWFRQLPAVLWQHFGPSCFCLGSPIAFLTRKIRVDAPQSERMGCDRRYCISCAFIEAVLENVCDHLYLVGRLPYVPS